MIGVFDSGVGGLSVLKELYRQLPGEDFLYVADAGHCPYGSKPVAYIRDRACRISEYLIGAGASVVVVACNTATAAAVARLRSSFHIPFVGMEPAVKPAAALSRSGVIGVLATANTFKGTLYHDTRERYASGIQVIETVGEGLVELVEAGRTEGPEAERLVGRYVGEMTARGADVIVLGCTHYPFLEPLIARLAGPGVRILNPAPAVARQTARLLEQYRLHSQPVDGTVRPKIRLYSTGSDLSVLGRLAGSLWPELSVNAVRSLKI